MAAEELELVSLIMRARGRTPKLSTASFSQGKDRDSEKRHGDSAGNTPENRKQNFRGHDNWTEDRETGGDQGSDKDGEDG